MTTAEIVSFLDGVAERHPEESEAIEGIITETKERTKIALQVERALHDAIKILEKGFLHGESGAFRGNRLRNGRTSAEPG